ncbi:Non-canonical purine NTP pyrophosphatase [Candidatus Gugararchaeum adminiculabundum]|nr:Non-canonical purine NTP pyrophosphatase [Candidatus Gugararchaeum adminiculabundum]
MTEAQSILKRFSINIVHNPLSVNEIRSESCEDISSRSAAEAYSKIRQPLIVEDSGLFIECLNGFPGTYSAWVLKKLELDGILRLMKGEGKRSAKYISSVAFADEKGVRAFTEECAGELAEKARGNKGFGYDPLFVPKGSEKTFGEDDAQKNDVSHRAKALVKFGEWFQKNR